MTTTGILGSNSLPQRSLAAQYQRWSATQERDIDCEMVGSIAPGQPSCRLDLIYILREAQYGVSASVRIVAMAAFGVGFVSGASAMKSTYHRLTNSITQQQYRMEIFEVWQILLQVEKIFKKPLETLHLLAHSSASAVGTLMFHTAYRCAAIFRTEGLPSWFANNFSARLRIYQDIGRLVVSLLLCTLCTPSFQLVGIWMLARALLVVGYTYLHKTRISKIGSLAALRSALLTGCSGRDKIDPLIGGGICSLFARWGALPLYFTVPSIVVLAICQMVLVHLRDKMERSGSPLNCWLRRPQWVEFVNYGFLFSAAFSSVTGINLIGLEVYAVGFILGMYLTILRIRA